MDKSDSNIDFIKGTHLSNELYKEIQLIKNLETNFYEVICTKHDNTDCHMYIGYDGTSARRTYNRVLTNSNLEK
ncbi:MAG: hypothetical protein Q4Q23_03625 [Methanobacteriaceae archaeon]|nr:hypothetical protein [Methanobacteriaceae archaeon]